MGGLQQTNKGKRIAWGGFITALGVICLYLANILPTTRLTFGAISSMLISIMLIEFGVRVAVITYASTSALALIIMPMSSIAIFYLAFLGYYGIAKYYIEKINNLTIEWILKMVFFNILIFILYLIISNIPIFHDFIDQTATKYTIWSTVALGEVAFIIYDYAYSVVIGYYMRRLRKLLHL